MVNITPPLFFLFVANNLVCGLASLVCPRVHCGCNCIMAKSPCAAFTLCISVSKFLITELISLGSVSARTLIVLDVEGWKYPNINQNTH